ncbi:hypothetical protein, partial [Chroococcidiopsis cubana]|uniref:hypothetical protein n=1 Tax=Chroococcidiopsis cubana TaxID=171392 RepID=UPI001A7EC386
RLLTRPPFQPYLHDSTANSLSLPLGCPDDKKIEKTITLTECGAYRITNPTTEFCGGMRSRDSLRIKDSYDEATDSKYR